MLSSQKDDFWMCRFLEGRVYVPLTETHATSRPVHETWSRARNGFIFQFSWTAYSRLYAMSGDERCMICLDAETLPFSITDGKVQIRDITKCRVCKRVVTCNDCARTWMCETRKSYSYVHEDVHMYKCVICQAITIINTNLVPGPDQRWTRDSWRDFEEMVVNTCAHAITRGDLDITAAFDALPLPKHMLDGTPYRDYVCQRLRHLTAMMLERVLQEGIRELLGVQ